MATFQLRNFPSANFPQRSVPIVCLAVALGHETIIGAELGPHCSLRRLSRLNLIFGELPLGKLLLGTSPPGKCPFGKYLTPSIRRSHSDAVMLTSRPSIQQKASLDLDCIPEVEMSIAFVFVFYILGLFKRI